MIMSEEKYGERLKRMGGVIARGMIISRESLRLGEVPTMRGIWIRER
jgi:hypothetical protein